MWRLSTDICETDRMEEDITLGIQAGKIFLNI